MFILRISGCGANSALKQHSGPNRHSFIKYIIHTAASMISMNQGANAQNAAVACDFTAPLLWYYTVQPQTFTEPFRVGNGIFLPDITFCNVTLCRDPAKNELKHPQNCCSGVSFRNATACPSTFYTYKIFGKSVSLCLVVWGSALWKLGHVQPEWLYHMRNSMKHLSLLSLLVPGKDLSAASAQSLLLAALSPSAFSYLYTLDLSCINTGMNYYF